MASESEYIMIDLSIENRVDGTFKLHLTLIENGISMPLGEINVDSVTLSESNITKYTLLND